MLFTGPANNIFKNLEELFLIYFFLLFHFLFQEVASLPSEKHSRTNEANLIGVAKQKQEKILQEHFVSVVWFRFFGK